MQANIDPQLNSRYKSEQMRKVLAASLRLFPRTFITNGGVRSPYFYESEHAIVFPPCSDTEGTGMETITQVLAQAKPHLVDHPSKCFLFPLAEERGAFLSWGPSRKHWVTLHYDPSTQIATVIDSRPTLVSYWYICQPIQDFLNAGLKALDLPHPVKKLNVVYQGIQHDDIRCGPWTAANIEGLACGRSLETQLTYFTAQDSERIVQHHIDRLYYNKSQPYRSLRDVPSSDAITVEDEDDYALVSLSNVAAVTPPHLSGETSRERSEISNEEDLEQQALINFDSDTDDDDAISEDLPGSMESLVASAQDVVTMVPPQETDHTVQLAERRRVLETVHSELSHSFASGAVNTITPSSSSSAQIFTSSIETVRIENPGLHSDLQLNVDSESSAPPQTMLQLNPGISGSMVTEKPMIRGIPQKWAHGGNTPPSSSFHLQFMYGLMLLGGLSLMIALVLCVPSIASSMVVTMALGSATSKVAFGAGVVSGLSFVTCGLLFYSYPKPVVDKSIVNDLLQKGMDIV
ncbi:MAG: hypothetical protein KBB94_02745 [Legionellaceae bacterium]|nr:hypothetical protein [Legionellaceae bacterium]MBP9775031.1 hypothetical protein [Legionellaceae bacterium]